MHVLRVGCYGWTDRLVKVDSSCATSLSGDNSVRERLLCTCRVPHKKPVRGSSNKNIIMRRRFVVFTAVIPVIVAPRQTAALLLHTTTITAEAPLSLQRRG